jgi:Zn-dependent metalloprotease
LKASRIRVAALTNNQNFKNTINTKTVTWKENLTQTKFFLKENLTQQIPEEKEMINNTNIHHKETTSAEKHKSLNMENLKQRSSDETHMSRHIPAGYKLRSRTTTSGTIRESLVSIASIQRRKSIKKAKQVPEKVDKIRIAHPDRAMIFHSNTENIIVEVLGDTGASANVTSKAIAIKTKRKIYDLKRPIPIEYANGTKGEVSEYCNIKLSINGYNFALPCYLTEDVGDIVILGVPFFMQHQVSIDWKKSRWLIRAYQDMNTKITWTAANKDRQWERKKFETKRIVM